MKLFKILVINLIIVIKTGATNWYVDPINGSLNGDGSQSNPWISLNFLIDNNLINGQCYDVLPYTENISQLINNYPNAPISSGDTINLHQGNYGSIIIQCMHMQSNLLIKAVYNETPVFNRLVIRSSSNLTFSGIHVEDLRPIGSSRHHLLRIEENNFFGPVYNIQINNSVIQSINNASLWTANQWVDNASDGLFIEGENHIIDNIEITNTAFGIESLTNESVFSSNHINYFSGDAIRLLGNNNLVTNNSITNCIKVDDNHDDGIQSWSDGSMGVGTGVNYGNKIINNKIIQQTEPLLLPCNLQGIGLFNGRYNNWDIIDNSIRVDHWHGISIYGGDNINIVRNFLEPMPMSTLGPPWISVKEHNQVPSTNIKIYYNITPDFELEDTVYQTGINCEYITTQNIALCDYIYGNSMEF